MRPQIRRLLRLKAAVAKGSHTRREWEFLQDYCGGRCVCCGAQFVRVRQSGGEYQLPHESEDPACWQRLTKDHIRPLIKDGSDAIENLQPLCQLCNSTKNVVEQDWRPTGWRTALDGALTAGWQRPGEICVGCPPGCQECTG